MSIANRIVVLSSVVSQTRVQLRPCKIDTGRNRAQQYCTSSSADRIVLVRQVEILILFVKTAYVSIVKDIFFKNRVLYILVQFLVIDLYGISRIRDNTVFAGIETTLLAKLLVETNI